MEKHIIFIEQKPLNYRTAQVKRKKVQIHPENAFICTGLIASSPKAF